jgi:peptidoglycan hydrolase-like amidase
LLDIRRERRRDGAVFIHLLYPGSEEILACEIFRNTFKLPSCPDAIEYITSENLWRFSGVGAGHGQGMAVQRAKALAEAGWSAEDILQDAYGREEDKSVTHIH